MAKENQAVVEAMAIINVIAMNRSKVWNKETLTDAVRPLLENIARTHREISDIESRNLIADHLDRICKMNGWLLST